MLLEKRFSPLFALIALGIASTLGGCSDDGKGGFTKGGDLLVTVRPNPVTFGSVATGQHQ